MPIAARMCGEATIGNARLKLRPVDALSKEGLGDSSTVQDQSIGMKVHLGRSVRMSYCEIIKVSFEKK